jgi:hypothetical protein
LTRTATHRRKLSLAFSGPSRRHARPVSAPSPFVRGELVDLLQQLRGEVEMFLAELGVRHDRSKNRESSRRT